MRTFKQATTEHLAALAALGWTVKADLKIPHATSPDGKTRLWFKPQAVYASPGSDFKAARSCHVDMRTETTAALVADGEYFAGCVTASRIRKTTTKTLNTVGALRALFAVEALAPRTRGSTTVLGLDALPADREAFEFWPVKGAEFGAARYFRVAAPELGGKLGAVRLADVAIGSPVSRRAAPNGHGDELYLDVPASEANMPATDTVTVIVGPASEAPDAPLVGWTWHPGEPLAPLAPGAVPTGETAVKIHNG